MKRIAIIIASLSFALLSGCFHHGPPKPTSSNNFVVQSPIARQAALAKVKFWRASGSFSIQEEGQKPEIANFVWWQTHHSYRISILSILDLYKVEIARIDGFVKLWKNGTLSLTAKTPEGILQELMGWSLPISNLQWWMKGMPAPQKHGIFYVKYDRFGHMIALKQNGWTLHFDGYKRRLDIPDFPYHIILTRPGFVVTIVVKERYFMMRPYYAPGTTA